MNLLKRCYIPDSSFSPPILFMMYPFPSLDELRKQFVVALSLFLRFLLVTIMKKLDDVFLHAILTVNLWM